jgi:hypothetical protein
MRFDKNWKLFKCLNTIFVETYFWTATQCFTNNGVKVGNSFKAVKTYNHCTNIKIVTPED